MKCCRVRSKPFIDDCQCYKCRLREKSVSVQVRSGIGTVSGHDFTDVIDKVRRVPIKHRGWQSVVYRGNCYQLHGGIRTPFFICTNNPID